MTEQERAVVPAQEGGLSFGQTHLRPQDFITPRVKIVQKMSKETDAKLAEPGDFFNVLTGENFGASLRVQPIQTFMQRVFLLRQERRKDIEKDLGHKLSEGDGLKCRSFDMETGTGDPGGPCQVCPLSQWRDNDPPWCTETYNVAASTDVGDLIVLSFSKSSAKVGKRLFSALRMSKAAPWTRFFDFATEETRNDRGTFHVANFAIASDRPPSELIRQAVEWAQELQAITIDVTPDEEPGDDAGPSDEDAPF